MNGEAMTAVEQVFGKRMRYLGSGFKVDGRVAQGLAGHTSGHRRTLRRIALPTYSTWMVDYHSNRTINGIVSEPNMVEICSDHGKVVHKVVDYNACNYDYRLNMQFASVSPNILPPHQSVYR